MKEIASFPILVCLHDVNIIQSMIRVAALIYTWAIMNRKPLSQYPDPGIVDELRLGYPRVNVRTWKSMLGISQWLLLVACPGSGSDTKAKYLRRKMGTSGMAIGMEAFPLTIAYCKAFWKVQRWIAEGELLGIDDDTQVAQEGYEIDIPIRTSNIDRLLPR
jgi:hypothetical protein